MTDEQIALELGLDFELSRKYDYDFGDDAKYYYFLSKTVDESIFEGCLNIPKPIENRETKNLDGKSGWVSRRFRFLSGRNFKKIEPTYEAGKELFGLSPDFDLRGQLSILMSFRDAYLDQLGLQAEVWVEIQNRIANVLKVYYLESISNNGRPKIKIRELFNELLDNPPLEDIPELLEPLTDESVSKQVLDSVKIGLEWSTMRKEMIIEQSIQLAEKYYVLELLIQAAISKTDEELKDYRIRQIIENYLPEPKEVALQIVNTPANKYSLDRIISALEITKMYIVDEELDDLRNHVSTIIRRCLNQYDNDEPSKNTIRKWINKYCTKAGIQY